MKLLFRNYFFLLFVVFFYNCASVKAQSKSFFLKWDMHKELELSNGIKIKVPLVENNFLDEHGNAMFEIYWDIDKQYNGVSYKIKNVVFEDVPENFHRLLSLEYISSELDSRMHIANAPDMHGVSLSMLPLIKVGNKVKKLVSFDIDYTLLIKSSKSMRSSTVSNSVLQSGNWYKFSIDKTGVFKLDKTFIENLGLSVANLDPRNIRIYGNGGAMLPNLNSAFRYDDLEENAIYVVGESDGVFNDSDYVLFYGRGADDWENAEKTGISHRKNIYSDVAYYFLNVDLGTGKRIAESEAITDAPTDLVTSYTDYLVKEDDWVNLIGAGQQWFGDSFLVTNVRNYNFNFENIDTSKELQIKVRGASKAQSSTSMAVSLNGIFAFNLNYPAATSTQKARAAVNSSTFFANDSNIDVKISYVNNGNPAAEAFLDYIEIIGDKLLIASGKQFQFRNVISQENAKVLEYSIENASAISLLWDVSDPINPKQIKNQSSGSTFSFKARTTGNLNEYIVLNNSNYYVPQVIASGPIANQNLHGLKDIQYLVITDDMLNGQAQRLANYHQSDSNLTTKVVSLKEIYNEFGSGSPDITAIRDFVRYLYENASSDAFKIKYLCLFGDATYDYKDRIPNNDNIVPVYLAYESFNLATSYVTDDYYGMMDPNEGDMSSFNKQDVATGRVLVSDEYQAKLVVDKILAYYNSEFYGSWRNAITLVTDDMTNASEYVFTTDMDGIATSIQEEKPQYNIKKIYADSYNQIETSRGSRYPDVNRDISNSMDNGTLLFNYFGHGGEAGFASEKIVTIEDIRSWVNFFKSPLFITITCDFTRFDNPARFTAGEEMVVSNTGGSASLISTTREVYISYGRSFNKVLIPEVLDFDGNSYSNAQALMKTKNTISQSSSQRFFIYYLGDPAMKLGIPEPMIRVTEINGKDVSQSRDTLKALSRIRIAGEVQDQNGILLDNFDGELASIIYDKPTDKKTLNNDGFVDGAGNPLVFDFEIQESIVFNGKSTVENGEFSFEFIVPKDIKLTYGNSKISLYFKNEVASKGGFDLETIIGGINESPEEDEIGPEIELFMEDVSFLDGATTSSRPTLIAQLSDKSGVNTSTKSVGHSITAVIDGNEGNPIVLNEFYETETGDFTKGTINYTLRDLKPGPHSLKLKVWDTYNNSSDKTLNFTVTESFDFVLENVLNYPNPFVDYTQFWFTHNQPNQLLDVQIYIYTVSGKLVKSIHELVQTSGRLVREISWNGKDDFGDRIGKGVYVYKIEVTNIDSGVRAEKFEKLVLLQ